MTKNEKFPGIKTTWREGLSWKSEIINPDTTSILPLKLQVTFQNFFKVLQGQQVELKTSGSTNSPKTIKINYRLITTDKNKAQGVWVNLFRPDTFGALEVLIRCYRSELEMIPLFENPFDLFGIENSGDEFRISMTPSTLRQFSLQSLSPRPDVTHVFLSGEPVTSFDFDRAKILFPTADIAQVYATTEVGAVFISRSDQFDLKPLGNQTVSIAADGELIVEVDGVTRNTGDLFVESAPQKWTYKGRKDRIFQVGGANVNPTRVETILENFPGVLSAVVRPKVSKYLGSVVEAHLQLDTNVEWMEIETQLRNYISSHLERHEEPQFYIIEDELLDSRSGKKKLRSEKS